MELLRNRYRDVTVLALVLGAQLFVLAWQVKSKQDVRLIRVWAMSGFMPLARVADAIRANTIGVLNEYSGLVSVKIENRKLKESLDTFKIENQFLRSQLSTAERGQSLAVFRSRSPSKLLAAHIIGTGTGAGAKVVFVDRGSNEGVQKGMAVITPDGIVGKISSSYPGGAQVILITDPSFAAGVISQKHRVQGTLKGQGHATCAIEYIKNEDPLEKDEWLYTSGVDRVFPKGLPVGRVTQVRQGKMFFKEVFLAPSGMEQGLEDVLIVIEGVHQTIPDRIETNQAVHLLPPPPPEPRTGMEADRVIRGVLSTDADHLLEKYKRIGTVTGHTYGAGGTPNFNVNVPPAPAPRTAAAEDNKPNQ
jgi:rod shape-determining protein MreC